MNRMERTNHGRGSALAMGLDTMHVCGLLEFDERFLWWNWLLHVCILLEFDERFCAGIDYCKCVFCWNLVTVYVVGLIIACVCVCSCWNHVSLLEPNDKLCVLQWISDSLPNCVFCSKFLIRSRNCIAYSEIVICCRNWVVWLNSFKQFYRRTNSVGERNELRRWNNYRRNTSVGIIVVGKSLFHR